MTLPAGVALDDLVFICTKIARQMDSQGGVDKVFEAMEAARAAIEDAKPLLSQAVKLSDEVGGWAGGRAGGGANSCPHCWFQNRGGSDNIGVERACLPA
jgi:hypothetical protein